MQCTQGIFSLASGLLRLEHKHLREIDHGLDAIYSSRSR